MLKQDSAPTEQAASPAQIRVTPEELAKALAAVEARREQSSREAAGTIPIGEAVQQLGFDVTPEEIWAEVQAGRVAHDAASKRRPRARRRAARILGTGTVLCLLLGTYSFQSFNHWHELGEQSARQKVGALAASQITVPASTTLVTPVAPSANLTVDPDTLIEVKAGQGRIEKTLSEIPNGQAFICSLSDNGTEFQPAGAYNSRWTLIKHKGKTYLRGWIPRMSARAMQVAGLDISDYLPEPASEYKPLTIALNGIEDSLASGNVIQTLHFHLDKYAWEKW